MRHRVNIWTKALRIAYVFSLTVAIVPYGSVHDPVIALVGGLFGILAVGSAISPVRTELQAPLLWATLLIGSVVLWALIQTLPIGVAHPSWAAAQQILGPIQGTIAVAPSATIAGLPSLLLPTIAFVTGIVIFQDDDGAKMLFRCVAWIALIGALIGLYEFVIAPEQLLFQPRAHHMGGVSAYFINRNTAGTFLGIGSILWLAALLRHLQEQGISGLRAIILGQGGSQQRAALSNILFIVAFITMIIALFLTKSRAGVAASLMGILISSISILQGSPQMGKGPTRHISPIIISIGMVVTLLGLYGSQFIGRLAERSIFTDGRWCFYKGMLEAIMERPLTGSGFANLQYAYPAYRDPTCFSLDLILDRGHNGYLELALGMGIGALAIFVAAIFFLWKILSHGISLRHRMRLIPAAALGALVTAVLHTTVDFSLQIPGVACFVAAILAAGVVSSCPARTKQRRSKDPVKRPATHNARADATSRTVNGFSNKDLNHSKSALGG